MTDKFVHNFFLGCHNCKEQVNIVALPERMMRHSVIANTLTQLPDHGNVEWQCPVCQFWNGRGDAATENQDT